MRKILLSSSLILCLIPWFAQASQTLTCPHSMPLSDASSLKDGMNKVIRTPGIPQSADFEGMYISATPAVMNGGQSLISIRCGYGIFTSDKSLYSLILTNAKDIKISVGDFTIDTAGKNSIQYFKCLDSVENCVVTYDK